MKQFAARRPFLLVLLISLVWLLVAVPVTQVMAWAAPDAPELAQRFVGLLVLTALALALLAWLGWWRKAGFNRMSEWRNLRLLWLPAVVLCWPLLYGVRPIGAEELGILLVGYALTGIQEEILARGIMLEALKPKGIWVAVLVTSLLFGAVHFGRLLFGSPLSLVLFQVLFAAFDGVLYAALRLRTNTLWTPIVIHAAADVALALGQVPQPLWRYLYLGSELLFLAYGLFLLRPYQQLRPRHELAVDA